MKPTIYLESLDVEAILKRPSLDGLVRDAVADRDRSDRVTLARRVDGQLVVRQSETETPVWVRRCFPWSQSARFVSLRNEDDDEVALVRDPQTLEPVSREVLERALVEAGFVMEIVALTAIAEEVEIRDWKVVTRQGPRRFQTRLDDWPREIPGGGVLVRDVAGDLYHVDDPASLDQKSRQLLWAFVD